MFFVVYDLKILGDHYEFGQWLPFIPMVLAFMLFTRGVYLDFPPRHWIRICSIVVWSIGASIVPALAIWRPESWLFMICLAPPLTAYLLAVTVYVWRHTDELHGPNAA